MGVNALGLDIWHLYEGKFPFVSDLDYIGRPGFSINSTLRNKVNALRSAIRTAPKVTEYGPAYDLEFTTQLRNMKAAISDQIWMQVIQCGKNPQDYI